MCEDYGDTGRQRKSNQVASARPKEESAIESAKFWYGVLSLVVGALTIVDPVSPWVEVVSSFSLCFQIFALKYLARKKAPVFQRFSVPAFTVLSYKRIQRNTLRRHKCP